MAKDTIVLPNGKPASARELVLRGLHFGRRMRRSIWKNHFYGMPWWQYKALEEKALKS